jgi:hypothetical protein
VVNAVGAGATSRRLKAREAETVVPSGKPELELRVRVRVTAFEVVPLSKGVAVEEIRRLPALALKAMPAIVGVIELELTVNPVGIVTGIV